MKKVKFCKNLNEVRTQIDQLDKDIIRMIAYRSQYVKQAAKIKQDKISIKAPDRVEKVIENARSLAVEYLLNPAIIEKIYRTMIDCFIDYEIKEYEKSHK